MQLISLSFAMFFGSFIAGAVPLTISLSEVRLNLHCVPGRPKKMHSTSYTFNLFWLSHNWKCRKDIISGSFTIEP